jgi:hypothetical protein
MRNRTTFAVPGTFVAMNSQETVGYFASGLTVMMLVLGCTTLVEVDLPEVPPQGVLEATVRLGEPPLVLLTTTQGYFDAVDASTLTSLFVGDADVTLVVDGESFDLPALCTGDLPPEALPAAAEFLGVSVAALDSLNLCVYTGLALPLTYGAVGKQYELTASWTRDGQSFNLTSSTSFPALPQLDSAWFEIPETSTNDSLGLIWTAFTDPAGLGQAYRWSSKREGRDPDFFYPLGSVFDDAFVDGQTFPFPTFRSPQPGVEETPGEEGFWKTGDTVVVRLEALSYEAFEVIRDFETSLANQGNPFALPSSASTNVAGGLGWFVAYSGVTDTVVCAP